jgi:hypothetical protein
MAQEQLSWRDNPRACSAISRGILSGELADLLDRLLQKDEVGASLGCRGARRDGRCELWPGVGQRRLCCSGTLRGPGGALHEPGLGSRERAGARPGPGSARRRSAVPPGASGHP